MGLIVKCLNLKNNQIIIDLGAGDGVVVFSAARTALKQKLNTKFIAIEINIILIIILYIQRFFHPNKNNIRIVWGDLFKFKVQSAKFKVITQNSKLITFYIYISPWLIDQLIKNIKSEVKNFTLISYMYSVKLLAKKEIIIHGHNNIYIYN